MVVLLSSLVWTETGHCGNVRQKDVFSVSVRPHEKDGQQITTNSADVSNEVAREATRECGFVEMTQTRTTTEDNHGQHEFCKPLCFAARNDTNACIGFQGGILSCKGISEA